MRRLALALLALSGLALAARARAEEDDGLGRIPGDALKDEAPRHDASPEHAARPDRSTLDRRVFLEDAFTASPFTRSVPVPPPQGLVPGWQDRTSLDGTLTWSPLKALRLVLSDRLSAVAQDGRAFSSSQTVENALREAFVSAALGERTFLEAGRINVRSGVALGFNPTDFMRARTLVGQSSLDPSVLRENRLGALMVRLESIFGIGAASVALAPEVASPPPLSGGPWAIDPRFGATNGTTRALATLSLHVLDLSPELLGYLEPGRQKLGLDLSQPVGSAIVAYGEWAGGREANLAARAHAFGVATGAFPSEAPVLPPLATTSTFRNDVATGFSLTVATAATLNLEYHFHEGGFSGDDLGRWLSSGSAPGASGFVPDALWFVRGYAADQEEPLARHQLFVRLDFPKTLRHDLDLGAFAFVNLEDGSSLSQLSASYYPSDAWTVSGYLSANLGSRRSEHGSHPGAVSAILAVRLYL